MVRRGAIALVTCGACTLALGMVLFRADTTRYQASDAAFRSAPHERGNGAETAGSGAARAINPVLFSPGACMAFPPTEGNRHQTVFLDAGHGGIDPGGVGHTQAGASVKESTVNLAIELDAMAILRAQGYRVVVSRTQNTTVTRLTPGDLDGALLTDQGVFNDVAARDVCANLAKANVLVGIYLDAASRGTPAASPAMTRTGRSPPRTSDWPPCCRMTSWAP